MTAKWTATQMREPRRRQELLEGLVLKFWPLLHSHAMPETPVAGNYWATANRMRVIRGYAEDHPVSALSRQPDEWLHRPFDVTELAHNFGDPVAVYA
mmetsp:Transcript_12419/g.29992  ORF Transcript_12419/g.29992 Transcript_12419/m.29992 type:complete len:97 (+) Transcript_12419:309-599(+)|eukprot:CAMPEP_0197616328 /NCGR_PEP_ID=MMETSP1326-20131121/60475_1 /TAXON_ID=1155430 /ORGANISM="Genus nov. species nov., Strain RCC2288" /LENGTH=96 /DNA_ID=CAMNT_0043185215 /DNA_START=132 /DNA_END=422 /DNA_ORIENTATION=+